MYCLLWARCQAEHLLIFFAYRKINTYSDDYVAQAKATFENCYAREETFGSSSTWVSAASITRILCKIEPYYSIETMSWD